MLFVFFFLVFHMFWLLRHMKTWKGNERWPAVLTKTHFMLRRAPHILTSNKLIFSVQQLECLVFTNIWYSLYTTWSKTDVFPEMFHMNIYIVSECFSKRKKSHIESISASIFNVTVEPMCTMLYTPSRI